MVRFSAIRLDDVVEACREGRNGAKLGPEEADLARGDLLLGKDSISRQQLLHSTTSSSRIYEKCTIVPGSCANILAHFEVCFQKFG